MCNVVNKDWKTVETLDQTCFGAGAVLTEKRMRGVENCACTCEQLCVSWCPILAEPEGGGAPALCHSVASAASFRT